MADFSGRKIAYAIALETVRGTPDTATTFWVRWETADFEDTATTILNQSALNVLDKYSGAEIVEQWSKGQFAGKITDQGFGLILLAAFDTYSEAQHAGETLVQDHTFSESQLNAAKTLTITRVDPNVQQQFANGMLTSLEILVKAGDFIRHVSQFVAQPSTTVTGRTVNYVAENEFKAKYAVVKFATTVGGLGAATAIPLNNCKITVNKNANPYWIIGQNNPSDIFANVVEITGEMQLRYSDQTYYTLRFNNTLQAVQINIVNTDVVIGNATNPTLTFTMPAAYLTDWKPDQSIDAMVQQTIMFTATYSLASGYAIQAVLTNLVDSYAPAQIS